MNYDDAHFLSMAKEIAENSICSRRKVGAVLVDINGLVISTGYNKLPYFSGLNSCKHKCPRGALTSDELAHNTYTYDDPGSCGYCISIHAEIDCIIGLDLACTKSTILYVTHEPCVACKKVILAAHITRVIWPDGALAYHALLGT